MNHASKLEHRAATRPSRANHKAKDRLASGSRGMPQASRAARKEAPEMEPQPLTKQEWEANRMREEQETRDYLKKLRDNWESHQAAVRMAEAKPKSAD